MKYINRDADGKGKRLSPFVVVSKLLLEDERLTLEQKGLMTILLGNRDDFNQNIRYLSKELGISEGKLKRILKALKAHGYIQRIQKRDENGKWFWSTFIYEVPPPVDKPANQNPPPQNPHNQAPAGGKGSDLISNNLNKEKELNNLLMSPTEPPSNKEELKGEGSTGISDRKRDNHPPKKTPLDYPDDLMF